MPRTTPIETLNTYNDLITKRDQLRQQLIMAQREIIIQSCGDVPRLSQSPDVQAIETERYNRLFIVHKTLMDRQNDAVLEMERLERAYPEIKRDSGEAVVQLREKARRKG